jgi:hypothetical protein
MAVALAAENGSSYANGPSDSRNCSIPSA